jgi:hypothetical protein
MRMLSRPGLQHFESGSELEHRTDVARGYGRATGGRIDAGHYLEERAFSCPIRTNQTHPLPLAYMQADLLQRFDLVPRRQMLAVGEATRKPIAQAVRVHAAAERHADILEINEELGHRRKTTRRSSLRATKEPMRSNATR